jgi:hypothetical protein
MIAGGRINNVVREAAGRWAMALLLGEVKGTLGP